MPIFHPCFDENGKPVVIKTPSTPSSPDTWHDPFAIATAVPCGEVPLELNGIAISPQIGHPRIVESLDYADDINKQIEEQPLKCPSGMKPSAGVVILEPDGRLWIVHPTNQFGGYSATFPKGTLDLGSTLQATAVRKALEESGLRVRITGLLGDFIRTTSICRLYLAKRIGGSPIAMGWESQAVSLAPLGDLDGLLNGAADKPVLAALKQRFGNYPATETNYR